ncbi:hypothetical protein GEMRC1_002231 [Eukaryota sp. GEM-RC1]
MTTLPVAPLTTSLSWSDNNYLAIAADNQLLLYSSYGPFLDPSSTTRAIHPSHFHTCTYTSSIDNASSDFSQLNPIVSFSQPTPNLPELSSVASGKFLGHCWNLDSPLSYLKTSFFPSLFAPLTPLLVTLRSDYALIVHKLSESSLSPALEPLLSPPAMISSMFQEAIVTHPEAKGGNSC